MLLCHPAEPTTSLQCFLLFPSFTFNEVFYCFVTCVSVQFSVQVTQELRIF
jgi:hypothetical protein